MAAVSYLGNNTLPRGMRNNNPGNIRLTPETWQGKIPYSDNKDWKGNPNNVVKEFEQFYELRYGLRALMRNIITQIKNGYNTIEKLITRYAPPSDGNLTGNYINSVVAALGVNAEKKIALTEENILALSKIIVFKENGSAANYITDNDYRAAIAILGVRLLKGSNATTLILVVVLTLLSAYLVYRHYKKQKK